MAIEFRVLGSVEARIDESAVDVGPARQRCVLAVLLIDANQVVSPDQLVDRVWGERVPHRAAATLRTYLSRLRQALAAADVEIRHRSGGYVLTVEPGAVDLDSFHHLVGQARISVDEKRAAALYEQALRLWRGEPFAGLDTPWLNRVRHALEAERHAAELDHTDLRLRLGQHGDLLAELTTSAATHPLDERLAGQLMLALYRSGRQADALTHYQGTRSQLAEELGTDPGPPLQQLHQRILTGDPTLTVSAIPESRSALPAPAQLSADLDTFTGRATELNNLLAAELVALHQAVLEQSPALRAPSSRVRTNLQVPANDLIGRADAVADVRALLSRSRLVTLTGPGGVGKTRLAVEVARDVNPSAFADGVWLVALTALQPNATADDVAELVLHVLDVRNDAFGGSDAPTDRLVAALRIRRTLLVLDNCEHLVDAVAEVAAAVLAATPDVKLLATSQEPLSIAGEHLLTVPPVAEQNAVALFLARAEAAGGHPEVLDPAVVATICRHLDGIPLALELAATRLRALGVHELAARLDDRFRLLAVGQRDAPARQQTLRATIDWSWRLLPDRERAVLRRLAVHTDGCTLGAAEQVCAGEGVDTANVVDLLSRLVDRSLVTTASTPTGMRYRLLESIAAYCLERLTDAGELDAIQGRHAAHYIRLAELAANHLRGQDQHMWLHRLDAETANLRAALDHALAHDPPSSLRLVNALAWSWVLRGRLRDAIRWLDRTLATPADSPDERVEAETWRAGIRLLTGEPVDVSTLDARAPARARLFLGFAATDVLEPAISERLIDAALADLRAARDTWGIAAALSVQSKQAYLRGDLDRAGRAGGESHQLFVELGDRWGQLQATEWLGALAESCGDYTEATRLHEDGLRIAEELGSWPQVADRLTWLAGLAMLRGDFDTARALLDRGLRLATEQGYGPGIGFAMLGHAQLARRTGDLDEAERQLQAFTGSASISSETLTRMHPTLLTIVLSELGFLAEQQGDAATALARHRESFAIAFRVNDTRAQSLALEGLAAAAALAGRAGDAATLLGAAAATRRAVGAPLPAAERTDVDRASTAAQSALGQAAYAAAYECGRILRPEEAVRALGDESTTPNST